MLCTTSLFRAQFLAQHSLRQHLPYNAHMETSKHPHHLSSFSFVEVSGGSMDPEGYGSGEHVAIVIPQNALVMLQVAGSAAAATQEISFRAL